MWVLLKLVPQAAQHHRIRLGGRLRAVPKTRRALPIWLPTAALMEFSAPARNIISLQHGTRHCTAEEADKHSSESERRQQQEPRHSGSNSAK